MLAIAVRKADEDVHSNGATRMQTKQVLVIEAALLLLVLIGAAIVGSW
ncbi:MAG TPA: hypothetical protein VHP35_04950 [Terriglobia bacterium]|jgi:hypothetical protein|nr:hypothetical protein [Terriglobia bacterium]